MYGLDLFRHPVSEVNKIFESVMNLFYFKANGCIKVSKLNILSKKLSKYKITWKTSQRK